MRVKNREVGVRICPRQKANPFFSVHQPITLFLISLFLSHNFLPFLFSLSLTHGFPHCSKPLPPHLASLSLSQLLIFPKPLTSFHAIKFSIFWPQVISLFHLLNPFYLFIQRLHFCQGTFQFWSTFSASFSGTS